MAHRVLVAVAVAWTAFYLVVYLAVIFSQGGSVAVWYFGMLIVAAVCLGAGIRSRAALAVGLAIDVGAAALAALTIGMLLLPAIAAATAALVLGIRRTDQAPPEPKARTRRV